MKIKLIILFFIFSSVAIIFGGAEIYNFYATSRDGNVVITWQTTTETNLSHFEIERATYNGSFNYVASISPNSSKSYQYIDNSADKTSGQVYNLYNYQIKIFDKDGNVSYSGKVSVAHSSVSSVKRTWGSIKALFR
jgi:hypothetical protein